MQPGSRKQGVFSTALHHLTLFFEQFKSFIKRGNVLELAVGVIIGAAFGKIVSSLVSDIVMPPLGMLLAKLDFRQLKLVLREARGGEPPVTINYGVFLSTILDFLIISVVIFFLVQAVQRLHRKPTAPNPETRECPRCVQVISRRATRCPHCTTEFEESGAEATASLRSGV
ncbi:MAG: large-conductance mechanosensitive channel protein MscL [Planctomycetaceae bacterium]|nr:large-conductance mechanosensitive channel protein MscL [Planctomycetaceae bacterium]